MSGIIDAGAIRQTSATAARQAKRCSLHSKNPGARRLKYIQSIHVGLAAVGYDFGLPTFGGIVSDYNGTPTTFANGLQCGAAGFGPGTLIQNWYRTSSVATQLQ